MSLGLRARLVAASTPIRVVPVLTATQPVSFSFTTSAAALAQKIVIRSQPGLGLFPQSGGSAFRRFNGAPRSCVRTLSSFRNMAANSYPRQDAPMPGILPALRREPSEHQQLIHEEDGTTWEDVSGSGNGLSEAEAARLAQASGSDLIETVLLFPTYARLSLTKKQAEKAAKMGQAAAAVPATPPATAAGRVTSYFSRWGSGTTSASSAAPAAREPSPGADLAGGSAVAEREASPIDASEAATSLKPPGPIEIEGSKDRHWLVNVKGWVYGTREQSKRRKILLSISRRLLASATVDAASGTRYDERAGLFLATSLQGVKIRVAVSGLTPNTSLIGIPAERKPRERPHSRGDTPEPDTSSFDYDQLAKTEAGIDLVTDASGFFSGTIQLPKSFVDKWREENAQPWVDHNSVQIVAFKPGEPETLNTVGQVELISPEGVSIISDVDDTIKESLVHEGKMAAINAALFAEAREVPGMADAYNYLRARNVSMHYVSAGPYQLYPMLSAFLKTSRFPLGSLNLRNVWERENMSSKTYKIKIITRIFQDFPDRKFLLLGDSGERDIETYTSLFSLFPSQIVKVFIRDVTSHKFPPKPPPRSDTPPLPPPMDAGNFSDPEPTRRPASPAKGLPPKTSPVSSSLPLGSTKNIISASSDTETTAPTPSRFSMPRIRSFPLRSREAPPEVIDPLEAELGPAPNPLVLRARMAFAAMKKDAWALFTLPEVIFTDKVVMDALNKVAERTERVENGIAGSDTDEEERSGSSSPVVPRPGRVAAAAGSPLRNSHVYSEEEAVLSTQDASAVGQPQTKDDAMQTVAIDDTTLSHDQPAQPQIPPRPEA
ncbi:uncharacterized protein EV422DRAFT_529811 [Fimicolochytrium jonesii]|uniref:uncharacterized protein n=1 Tax=Fimicolochytrium jonesii TaxID=1396493 RepID=UPI0022FEDB39|nr:uncharacterized protein EV422DRAFT_529811 [Fimicolochytrium jonesii]KAI8820703.1 hypothetical protein EV422DRAFT_529811 [Fimicolochytrium jonesii]